MERGQYKIIRADGTETIVAEKPTMDRIYRAIGIDCADTLTLNKKLKTIMIVDDTGMLNRKPVNQKATELMRQAFGPQYPYSIHGDVAIVNDRDFA